MDENHKIALEERIINAAIKWFVAMLSGERNEHSQRKRDAANGELLQCVWDLLREQEKAKNFPSDETAHRL